MCQRCLGDQAKVVDNQVLARGVGAVKVGGLRCRPKAQIASLVAWVRVGRD